MTRPRRVLLTKPAAQVARWRTAFETAGWQVSNIPLLQLEWLAETPEQRAIWQDLAQFHGVLMISPMAAQWCVRMLDTWWPQPPLGLHWLGPGPGTADVFASNGQGLVLQYPPHGHRAEDVLALTVLQQPQHQRWLIVAGEGGRSLLQDTLTERGALVTRLVVYRRHPRQLTAEQRQDIESLPSESGVLQISSQLALESLTSQLSEATTQRVHLLVSSPRLQQRATELGWQCVMSAQGASLSATLDALST